MAVILDNDGRVLLTKRSIPPFQNLWVMPGGAINLGESIPGALKREVREEVGLEIEVEGLIDVFEHLAPGEENCHYVILYYRCRALSLNMALNEHEVAEASWVSRNLLNNYTIPAGARFILEKVFPGLSLQIQLQ